MRILTIATSIILSVEGIVGDRTLAQITPDRTLGAENSQMFRDASGRLVDIGGGAIRGTNLFHSFTEFNVGGQQQVYFTHPAGIENILSRVTGGNPSEILGTLGVNGNANLFLLNPNGILFGRDARLDVAGSFVATTADRFSFNNGLEFSAVDPDLPPLLTLTINPGVQPGRVVGGTITNRGNLTAGQDLSLIANTLNLSGRLQAGRALTLRALDTVRIRDRSTHPFLASAGGDLRVQGDRQVNIFALNHPNSGLFAGENLVLRSANGVQGDARYTAGGDFRIEQLNGRLGSLSSPYDPIIRANGNVSFTRYTGASLHIFAGGAVNIGSIEITGTDATNSINETVVLSDGSTLRVNGATQPTLDIRAGTTAVGTPSGVTGTPAPTGLSQSTPTSADITIGEIILNQPDGLIFLTNQYQPNSLNGTIELGLVDAIASPVGGSIILDARNGITLNDIVEVSGVDLATNFITGNGGDVTLLAGGDIRLNEGAIISDGLLGGNIRLNSEGSIAIRGTGNSTESSIASNTFTDTAGASSGSIEITARSLSSSNAGNIAAITFGNGNAGNITISADDFISLDNSEIVNVVEVGATGSGGDIDVTTRSLSLENVSGILALTLADGAAGDVNLTARESASLNDSQVASFVNLGAAGQGGNLNLSTSSLLVTNGAQVSANTLGLGSAGQVRINAADSVILDGISDNGIASGVFSNVFNRIDADGLIIATEGNGGNIDLTTRSLSILNGAQINASTEGIGDAGNINLNANSVRVTGTGFDSFQNIFSPSSIVSEVLFDADGAGGSISLTAATLEVSDGAQISASTDGLGNAGNLDLNITDSVTLTGTASGLFADTLTGSSGNGGSIFLSSNQVLIRDEASIGVGSDGFGVGGNIQIDGDSLFLDSRGLISARTASTTGGNITLNLANTIVLRRESEISTTAGTAQAGGDGGNVTVDTNFLVAVESENSDITANAFQGQGGNISITAIGVFGIAPREAQTELSDITASSEFGVDGVIEINRPDVDPSRGTAELPTDVVDASRLVAQGCSAGNEAIASQIGEFTITGRGGLPPSPTEQLNGDAILADWEPLETPADVSQADSSADLSADSSIDTTDTTIAMESAPTELVEAQGWRSPPTVNSPSSPKPPQRHILPGQLPQLVIN
ncbi:MAG: filamentous hemagglutinin N-terminal domain-containing protein [Leptolyngbyaceae cyanobacterium RM1_406_9]|nr:filamentous hemagglutinin N-terminal domain-containing protein [Leptolyngbyaceae cyanobacterium RM1_406_9]